jgi:ABC-type multidrug transport system fused ATPase/permease subunit
MASFASLVFTFVLEVTFFLNYLSTWAFIIILVLVPALIFLLGKKRIKQHGRAVLNSDSLEIQLHNTHQTIQFDELKSYLIQFYQGVVLKFKLRDGRKYTIVANNNFLDAKQFGQFCTHLEHKIEKYYTAKKIASIREKSFLEKKSTYYFLKCAYYFLVIMSLAIVLISGYAIIAGKPLNISHLLILIGTTGSLWASYHDAKSKLQIKDSFKSK